MNEHYKRTLQYLEEIKNEEPAFFNDVVNLMNSVSNGEIPEKFPETPDILTEFSSINLKKETIMMLAQGFCHSQGFYGAVTNDYCKNLKKEIGDKKVLEIMGGRGFLAKGLSKEGASIISTDNFSWDNIRNPVFNVEDLSAQSAIQKYKNECDILLISWPPLGCHEINDAIQEWGSKKNIIYIGEEKGGCCANNDFFDMLHMNSSDVKQNNFSRMHDGIFISTLKKEHDPNLKTENKTRFKR